MEYDKQRIEKYCEFSYSKRKAAAKTAGMHDIGGVPKVDLRDNAMPKDIMVTPRISKMYLIINFLSIIKPFPFIIHLNLTRF